VRDGDTVARVGGDEFLVVLESLTRPGEADEVAARIQSALRRPGRSQRPADRRLGERRHRRARRRRARRHADPQRRPGDVPRQGGRVAARHETFVDALATGAEERLATETALRRAISESELRLVYQPIVDLRRNRLVALEALVRWQHPERGMLGPGQFLPVARESGQLPAVTNWVIREALDQIGRWNLDPGDAPPVHVNVPAVQLADAQFADRILALLADTGVEAQSLCLEVTEDALVDVSGGALERLERLRSRGVPIALDDFGTGYSSLSQLRQLPVDTLKIDLSFTARLTREPEDAVIVKTIVDLAHGLGLGTTAEASRPRSRPRPCAARLRLRAGLPPLAPATPPSGSPRCCASASGT
jgi:EAL domain-containing protein (putative c-di-GMP-specific phosphodiesterase class I)